MLKPTKFDYSTVFLSDSSDSEELFTEPQVKPFFNIDIEMSKAYKKMNLRY